MNQKNIFSELSSEECLFLMSVMYRAGICVSYADDDGATEEDDGVELNALTRILSYIKSHDDVYGAVVSATAWKALDHKDMWPQWAKEAEDADSVMRDAAKSAHLLRKRYSKDEAKHFCKAIMVIGTSVAKSYREEVDYVEEESGVFGVLADKVNRLIEAVVDPRSLGELNVSPAEDTVLQSLHQSLSEGLNRH